MAVDNASQIDAIANDKENACLVLLITDHLTLNSRREESYDRATRMIRSRYFVMLRKVHLTVTRGSSLRISRNSSDRL